MIEQIKIKVILTLCVFFLIAQTKGQVIHKAITLQVGNTRTNLEQAAALQIDDTIRGFLLPRLTIEQRDAIINPSQGLTIYNKTTDCIEWYQESIWYNSCGFIDLSVNGSAKVASWECNTGQTGTLQYGQTVSGVTQTLTANVTQKGSFSINSSMSGILFSASGIFTTTGPQTVVMTATGTPNAIGNQTFVLNTNPNCSFDRNVAKNSFLAPSTPTHPYAVSGDALAKVFFSPSPLDDKIENVQYKVTSTPGNIDVIGQSSPIIVSGLTNGQSYTFTVTAFSDSSSSAPSQSTNDVVPSGLPSSPSITEVTRGSKKATIYFNPPLDNGGTTITSYVVQSNPEGKLGIGTVSPVEVTGLTNGKSYTFRVKAINKIGSSPFSDWSAAVVPATTPDSPTNVTALAGFSSAIISFDAPDNNGGDPISNYIVTASPSGATSNATSSPIEITGLTNGESYTFTVEAENTIGKSSPSQTSNSVIPALTVPGIPTITGISYQNGKVTIAFNPPTKTGGTDITGYLIKIEGVDDNFYGTTSPIDIDNLQLGVEYAFSIQAINEIGYSNSSSPTKFTPMTVPDSPIITRIVQVNQTRASISYIPPGFNGGSAITTYTITSNPPGFELTTSDTTVNLTGLTSGQTYTFTVVAKNSIGSSLGATSESLTLEPIGAYLTNYYNGVTTN